MRDLTPNQQAETQKASTEPFHLVELQTPTATYRWSSRATAVWRGQEWTGGVVRVDGLAALAGGSAEARISLSNSDNAASALALVDNINDSPCRIYQLYGAAPHADADAALVFAGVVDGVPRIGTARVTIDLLTAGRAMEMSPRLYFELFCSSLPPAGTVISWAGEHYRLEARNG